MKYFFTKHLVHHVDFFLVVLTDLMDPLHHNHFLQYRPFIICLNGRDFLAHTLSKLWVLLGSCWRSNLSRIHLTCAVGRCHNSFYFRLTCSYCIGPWQHMSCHPSLLYTFHVQVKIIVWARNHIKQYYSNWQCSCFVHLW